MEDKRSKVEIYTDKDGRRRRRLVPVEPREQDPKRKVKVHLMKEEPQKRDRKISSDGT